MLSITSLISLLTETWLSKESAEFCNLDGYNVYHPVHAGRMGGGLAIFCSRKIISKKLLHLCISIDKIEACVVELVFCDVNLIILCVYRPHSDTISNFDVILIGLLHHHSLTSQNIIIISDFNINLLSDCLQTEMFRLNLQSLHFLPVITKPNRFSHTDHRHVSAPSLLNHILINFDLTFISGILYSDITDDFPTFLLFRLAHNMSQKVRSTGMWSFSVVSDF